MDVYLTLPCTTCDSFVDDWMKMEPAGRCTSYRTVDASLVPSSADLVPGCVYSFVKKNER